MSPDEEEKAPPVTKCVDYLFKFLDGCGMNMVFGVPGGLIQHPYAKVVEKEKFELVYGTNETGSVFCMDGYYRSSGKPAVGFFTAGPGALNAMLGVGVAQIDETPMLLIFGNPTQRHSGQNQLQGSVNESDVCRAVQPLCKYAELVTDVQQFPSCIRKAVAQMNQLPKGPAALVVPHNLWGVELKEEYIPRNVMPSPLAPDWKAVREIHILMSQSDRRILWIGNGCRHSVDKKQLVALAEFYDCLVVSTPKAKGIFQENHRRCLGTVGYGALDVTKDLLGIPRKGKDPKQVEPCTILVLGSSLGENSTFNYSPALQRHNIVQVDANICKLGNTLPIKLGVQGATDRTIEILLSLAEDNTRVLTEENVTEDTATARDVSFQQDDWQPASSQGVDPDISASEGRPTTPKQLLSPTSSHAEASTGPLLISVAGKIPMREICQAFSDCMPKEDRTVEADQTSTSEHTKITPVTMRLELVKALGKRPTDIVQCAGGGMFTSFRHLCLTENQRFFCNVGFAAMTHGIGCAIGAKLADARRTVVCITGDGSCAMQPSELRTAVQENVAAIFIIENNGGHVIIQQATKTSELFQCTELEGSVWSRPCNFAELGKCFGCESYRAEKTEDLPRIFKDALDYTDREKKPVIIDVCVDPKAAIPFGERYDALSSVETKQK